LFCIQKIAIGNLPTFGTRQMNLIGFLMSVKVDPLSDKKDYITLTDLAN
jgi:hypothetical protein